MTTLLAPHTAGTGRLLLRFTGERVKKQTTRLVGAERHHAAMAALLETRRALVGS